MIIDTVPSDRLAERAASHIAQLVTYAVAERGRATLALSGGSTPRRMFAALATQPVPWPAVHVLQVDERVAPDGDPDRNLTQLTEVLLDRLSPAPAGVYAMPVGDVASGSTSAADAAATYDATLRLVAGAPPVIDVVHLGLGDDGHTASLLPDDPALAVEDRAVAATGPYRGHRRLTLTYPTLERARHLVWLVSGEDKGSALARWQARDPGIPAGRLAGPTSTVVTDLAP